MTEKFLPEWFTRMPPWIELRFNPVSKYVEVTETLCLHPAQRIAIRFIPNASPLEEQVLSILPALAEAIWKREYQDQKDAMMNVASSSEKNRARYLPADVEIIMWNRWRELHCFLVDGSASL